ncbi:MAG: hypothetical protein AAGA03_02610 [Planctomycetota bacterium]
MPILGMACVFGCGSKPAPESSNLSPSEADPVAAQQETEPEPVELESLPEPEGDSGGFSIGQVMRLAHDNKLYRNLLKPNPDKAVIERIHLLYKGLPQQTPPKGESESWQIKTTALIAAVDSIASGEADGDKALKRAVNCNSCHSRHRE